MLLEDMLIVNLNGLKKNGNFDTIYCNLAISLIKGTGGFVPDAGSTTHGTDYPF